MQARCFLLAFVLPILAALTVEPAFSQPPPAVQLPELKKVSVQQLSATTLNNFPAPEADQGVAVDSDFFYPVDNTVVGKYEKSSGKFIARWAGPKDGPVKHVNSCKVAVGEIRCANSNYSDVPMASSIEFFDRETLQPTRSHSLGMTDEGSLVWIDQVEGGFIAGFAHYSKNGGLPFKGSEYSSVVTYDDQWRRKGGWILPASLLERMAPYAASGGAIGPDGLLYLLGHDLPEMYVLAKPKMGPELVHVATIALEAEGQAFSFDPDIPNQVWVIDRRKKLVRLVQLPELNIEGAQGFR